MKKALTLLAVAAMAAVSFVGCSKTYDVDASLETGTANYDFNGKTIVNTDFDFITKTVVVKTSIPGTAVDQKQTLTEIPYQQTVTTIVFTNDDAGTFTMTQAVTLLAGADGDYRNTSVTSADGNTVTTVTYTGTPAGTALYSGFAGKAVSTSTVTGTWKSYDLQTSATVGQTKLYKLNLASEAYTNTSIGATSSVDAPVITGDLDGRSKLTYKAGQTDADSYAFSNEESCSTTYLSKGTILDATGAEKDVVSFSINSAPVYKQFTMPTGTFIVQ